MCDFYRAILRRGFAFSASIKNPPLLKSRNIQSQTSVTANVPIPLIGSTHQPVKPSTSSQTSSEQSGIHIKDTSKLQQYHQHHTSTTSSQIAPTGIVAAATAASSTKQVRQKLNNESDDLPSCSGHSHQMNNEHIVWPKRNYKSLNIEIKPKQKYKPPIYNGIKKLWFSVRHHVMGDTDEPKQTLENNVWFELATIKKNRFQFNLVICYAKHLDLILL